jgi:hypothetical protein
MMRVTLSARSFILLVVTAACYRLPLRIKENDASGYEDIGVPIIEAVEYTPSGRDVRVMLEAPGYVTVIVVDPARGASVRFRRGELQSQYSSKGLHRYPLDRLVSPLLLSQITSARPVPASTREGTSRPVRRVTNQTRGTLFDIAPATPSDPARDSSSRLAVLMRSRAVRDAGGAVTATHVLVLITERPLDYVSVATRLARGSLDPAEIAQSAADVVQGGRWMAATALLRGQ